MPQHLLMVHKVYLDEIIVTALLTYIYAATTSFINNSVLHSRFDCMRIIISWSVKLQSHLPKQHYVI